MAEVHNTQISGDLRYLPCEMDFDQVYDEDSVDLYADLLMERKNGPNIAEMKDKIDTLSRESKRMQENIENLQNQNEALQKEKDILIRNISCLYKTAKLEIERKNKQIAELRNETSDLKVKLSLVSLKQKVERTKDVNIPVTTPSRGAECSNSSVTIPSNITQASHYKDQRHGAVSTQKLPMTCPNVSMPGRNISGIENSIKKIPTDSNSRGASEFEYAKIVDHHLPNSQQNEQATSMCTGKVDISIDFERYAFNRGDHSEKDLDSHSKNSSSSRKRTADSFDYNGYSPNEFSAVDEKHSARRNRLETRNIIRSWDDRIRKKKDGKESRQAHAPREKCPNKTSLKCHHDVVSKKGEFDGNGGFESKYNGRNGVKASQLKFYHESCRTIPDSRGS